MDNLKKCSDYIFEYFCNYLDEKRNCDKISTNTSKLEKYRKNLSEYSPLIQEWLIDIYDKYNNQLNISLRHILDSNKFFLLYYTEHEFQEESEKCYLNLIQRYPYLNKYKESIYMFVKDHHRKESEPECNMPYICREIYEWITETKEKYKVNLEEFAYKYALIFYDEEESWPITHRIISQNRCFNYNQVEYDYKMENNLFNLDLLYPKISNKPFIKDKKKYLEILIMYYYLTDVEGDEEYFKIYLKKYFTDHEFNK